MNNHYIRTNSDGVIVYAFSDAFIEPLETDILVEENGERHYNPEIMNMDGQYLYTWVEGEGMVPRVLEPIIPAPTLEDRTKANEDAINFLLGTVIL